MADQAASNNSFEAKSLSGVGGWLAVLIFWLAFLWPLSECGETFELLKNTLVQVPGLSRNGIWEVFKVMRWSITLMCMAISIIAGLKLYNNHKPKSVQFAKIILWIIYPGRVLLYSLAIIATFGFSYKEIFIKAAIADLIVTSIIAGAWTIYLKKSARVKNTYFSEQECRTAPIINSISIRNNTFISKRKLTGWQRIYLIAFAIYFVGCTIYCADSFLDDGIYQHTYYNITRLENELQNRGLAIAEIKKSAGKWYTQKSPQKTVKFESLRESELELIPFHSFDTPIGLTLDNGMKDYVYSYIKLELKIDPDKYIDEKVETGLSNEGKEILVMYPLVSILFPIVIYMSIIIFHRAYLWIAKGFRDQ